MIVPVPRPDILSLVRARRPKVLVVGEAILDRWLSGPAERMSREAPVPVVDVHEQRDCAGGAANTAVNLAALGAAVRFVSVVGDDPEGRRLLELLANAGVDCSGVVVSPDSQTASKTRVVGAEQILVRVDRGCTASASALSSFHSAVADGVQAIDALVICDYDAGLLTPEARELVISLEERPGLVLVDAHDPARWAALRPDVITPNAREAAGLLAHPLPEDSSRADSIEEQARGLLEASGAHSAVITLDRDGTVAIDADGSVSRTHAHPVLEQQASGAGDTFAAALTIALVCGAALGDAAAIAQRAADIVVRRQGTSICSLAELEASLGDQATPKVLALPALRERLDEERRRKRRIVFTNGCFDVIHRGHTTHLRQAKQLGDLLVVALNDDESVRRLKGDNRPVNTLADRLAVIEALDCVDLVTSFTEDTPIALLAELRPDVYVKGGDYTPEMLQETETVRAYGGDVRILDYLPHRSTSQLLHRMATGA